MKRKQIEQVPPKRPEGMKGDGTRHVGAQLSGKYLILDLWKERAWVCRHVMDVETGEYGSYRPADCVWVEENLQNALCDQWLMPGENILRTAKEDREPVADALGVNWPGADIYEKISSMEYSYLRHRREMKEWRRVQRVRDLMDSVPTVGGAVYDWIAERAAGSLQYAFLRDKASGTYHCTACGGDFTQGAAGVRPKHRREISCPLCGETIVVEKVAPFRQVKTRLTLIHGLDEKRGIERHFL